MNIATIECPKASEGKISVTSVTPIVGARIEGIDLTNEIDADTVAEIRATILKHKVVFFSGQKLNAESFLKFAELLGPITMHHPVAVSTADNIKDSSDDAKASVWTRDNNYRSDHWHSDVTFLDRPVAFSLLHCLTSPPSGGDTLFSNTVTAYEMLPLPLKQLADSLRAIHSLLPRIRADQIRELALDAAGMSDSIKLKLSDRASNMESFIAEHPVVRVHSETGERSLLLGSFVERIVGLPLEISTAIIQMFQHYITLPENVVRWSWTAGDLAIWDNRATQHYAVNDYGNAERLMQRLTVAGGVPIGSNGEPGLALRGDASAFSVLGPA